MKWTMQPVKYAYYANSSLKKTCELFVSDMYCNNNCYNDVLTRTRARARCVRLRACAGCVIITYTYIRIINIDPYTSVKIKNKYNTTASTFKNFVLTIKRN